MPASAAGKPVEIWFQDEARVGQQGTLSYVWAPIGTRPPAVRDNRHDSVYLFGAVCPERATGAAIIMPGVNSEAMAEHLAEISRRVSEGAHAVVVCDGAGWHQPGCRLVVPDNISLLRLPPYAPELAEGRVPGRGVGAVGKSPAVATAESLAEAGDLSTAVVTVAVLGRVGLRDTTLTQGPPR